MMYIYDDLNDINLNLQRPHTFKQFGGHGFAGYECSFCGISFEANDNYTYTFIFYDKNHKSIKAPECILNTEIEDLNSQIEIL